MVASVACLFLAACSTTGGPNLDTLRLKAQDDLADLRAFSIADVEAAQAMAQARGDLAASTCYPEVLVVLRKAQQGQPPVKGVVSAFEAVRLIVRPPVPPSGALQVACMALLTQTVADLVKFDVAIAKAVASGGASLAGDGPGAAVKVVQLLKSLGVGVGE